MDKDQYFGVPQFEDSYEINLLGEFRSIDRYINRKGGQAIFCRRAKNENIS